MAASRLLSVPERAPVPELRGQNGAGRESTEIPTDFDRHGAILQFFFREESENPNPRGPALQNWGQILRTVSKKFERYGNIGAPIGLL